MSPPGRVLILGAAGQLGRQLCKACQGSEEIIACERRDCDLSNPAEIRETVRRARADVILNAAAYTAVDRAETEKELATAINSVAPGVLAEEALRQNALLIHYSTDYVFDGTKEGPWVETDSPNPLNHYGVSKLLGEQAVAHVGGKHVIFRTSWVYGPEGKNFLLTMLRVGREKGRVSVVDDQYGAPTTAAALASATRDVVHRIAAGELGPAENWAGLYHMTCAGATSWCGFAREIFAQAARQWGDRVPEVTPIKTEDWPTPAKRPRNSILANNKLQSAFKVTLPHWRDELERAIEGLRF